MMTSGDGTEAIVEPYIRGIGWFVTSVQNSVCLFSYADDCVS